MARAKGKPVSIERFNVWKFYIPEKKKEFVYKFFELAEKLGKSKSGAVMEALEKYYPLLEEEVKAEKEEEKL